MHFIAAVLQSGFKTPGGVFLMPSHHVQRKPDYVPKYVKPLCLATRNCSKRNPFKNTSRHLQIDFLHTSTNKLPPNVPRSIPWIAVKVDGKAPLQIHPDSHRLCLESSPAARMAWVSFTSCEPLGDTVFLDPEGTPLLSCNAHSLQQTADDASCLANPEGLGESLL